MTAIGFIGLGNMGLPMATRLVAAGHEVAGYDRDPATVERLTAGGARAASSLAEAIAGCHAVITMLPEGRHVRDVYGGDGGILALAASGTLLIDCSTVDVDTARDLHRQASELNLDMLDAPVSGGVAGAAAGTLTFMVGGAEPAFERALPILRGMAKNVVHAGPAGNGQAAKICNNMILGISMIAVSEAFVLAERLGLDAKTLFEISAASSGQCWSLTSYCPVPGPVPSSPANRDFAPGFTVAMMLKDLRLAQSAAQATSASTPLGAQAAQLYTLFNQRGSALDFSAIIQFLRGENT